MSKRLVLIFMISLALCELISSCGKKKVAPIDRIKELEVYLSKISFQAELILPGPDSSKKVISWGNITRTTRTGINDSTVPNSRAYTNSLVIGVVRAAYKVGKNDFAVVITQFASPLDAYGFYSQSRPRGVALDSIEAESFYLDDTLHFTKGEYSVSITSPASSKWISGARTLARMIDARITSMTQQPLYFRLFPFRGQIVPSQRYYSRNFMDVEGLDSVYSIDYASDEDTLTLFLTPDSSGIKFLELSDWAKKIGKINQVPPEFEFPEKNAMAYEHSRLGPIVAGTVKGKLVGIIGYNRATGIELCTKWVKGLL